MISINSDNSVTRSLLRSSFLGCVVDTVLLIYLISFCLGGEILKCLHLCVFMYKPKVNIQCLSLLLIFILLLRKGSVVEPRAIG